MPQSIPTTASTTASLTTQVSSAPGAAAAPKYVVPVNAISDRLPGLNRLPDDIRPLVVIAIDLALLVFLFFGLRMIIIRTIRGMTERIAHREEGAGHYGRASRLRTLTGLINNIIIWTLGFVFIISGLVVLNANVTPLLASASVIGLALGLGSQKLAKDLISGFFLLLEDQFAVGDYVTINSVTGTVEELVMRTTRIRDDNGKLYTLSNGDIGQVCNQSRNPVSGSFDVILDAGVDVARATTVLNDALASLTEELKLQEAAKVSGIATFDNKRVTLTVGYKTPGYIRPGSVVMPLRDKARAALAEAQIPLGPPTA